MAPEQARGEPVGPPADVFSLGVVLYRLCTGVLPWPVESLADLAAVGETLAPPLRELAPEASERVEAAIMRPLARNPVYRQADAHELAAELGAGGRDGRSSVAPAASAPTLPVPRRAERGRRGARWLVPLLALALASVGLLGFAVALADDGDAPRPGRPGAARR